MTSLQVTAVGAAGAAAASNIQLAGNLNPAGLPGHGELVNGTHHRLARARPAA